MTLTKAHLANLLVEKRLTTRGKSLNIVDAVFNIIKDTLADGEDILISGFGTFYLWDKNSRRGRNPQTGDSLTIAARRVVLFQYSGNLRERMNRPEEQRHLPRWYVKQLKEKQQQAEKVLMKNKIAVPAL